MAISSRKKTSLVKGLGPSEITKIASVAKERSYPPHFLIFSEGSQGNSLHMITSGKVRVTKSVGGEIEETIAFLEKGEFFGEMTLLDGGPRSASVTTVGPVTTIEISRDSFKALLKKNSSAALGVLMSVIRSLSLKLRQTTNKFRDFAQRGEVAKSEVESMRQTIFSLISHELRTPLAVIKTSAEALGSRGIDEERRTAFLEKIEKQSNRLAKLIDDLITLSQIQAGRLEFDMTSFRIASAVDGAASSLKEMADEKGIALGLSLSKKIPLVYGDEAKVRDAIYNLLKNAIEFTREGGKVELEVSPSKRSRLQFVRVSVRDTGAGIPQEKLGSIFDPFQQVDSSSTREIGGTGLGLSLTKEIVEAHGGEIWVDSKVGEGSTFTFTLPVRDRSKRK